MVTLDAINLKIAKLQKQAAAVAEKQTSLGLTKIRELMQKHGLSVADIETFVGKKRGRKSAPASTNGATRAPRASVHDVAPKYADPKTGATWSGRGRAPAWIRDVKDRSKFLIDTGAKTKVVAEKAAPARNASAKRAVAKKGVARKAATTKAATRRVAAPVANAPTRKAAAPARKKTTMARKAVMKKASPATVASTSEGMAG